MQSACFWATEQGRRNPILLPANIESLLYVPENARSSQFVTIPGQLLSTHTNLTGLLGSREIARRVIT